MLRLRQTGRTNWLTVLQVMTIDDLAIPVQVLQEHPYAQQCCQVVTPALVGRA